MCKEKCDASGMPKGCCTNYTRTKGWNSVTTHATMPKQLAGLPVAGSSLGEPPVFRPLFALVIDGVVPTTLATSCAAHATRSHVPAARGGAPRRAARHIASSARKSNAQPRGDNKVAHQAV